MIARVLIALLLVWGVVPMAWSVEKQSSLIIFTEELPPYNFIDNAEIQGINIDIVKRACLNAKIACRFEIYPWNRSVKLARTIHNGGLVSTSRTPPRENYYKWVGPLVASTTCFYSLADNESVKINHPDDLKRYTIGLQHGDVYEELLSGFGLSPGVNYVYFSTKFEYVHAFKARKLDLFLASINTLPSHLKHLKFNHADIKPVYSLTNPELGGNYLALNKNVSNTVIEKLQKQVDVLMTPENLLPIKSRYLGSKQAKHSSLNTLAGQCLPA